MESANKPPAKPTLKPSSSPSVPPSAPSKPKTPAGKPPPSKFAKQLPTESPWKKYAVLIVIAVIALGLLGKYALSTVSKKIETTRRAEAEAIRVQTTGVLLVKSNLPEATVEATRVVGPNETPPAGSKGSLGQALGNLAPGKYRVTLQAAGWPDTSGEVDVPAGQTTETTVNFPAGSLHVDSAPAGATVKWKGTVLGKTPVRIPQLPPGELDLSIEYSNWPAVPLAASVAADTESSAAIRLPHGRLTVDSLPAGAIVVLDGKAYKQTPLFFDPIAVGPKKLTLQARDFPPLEVSVDVVDGEETKIRPLLGNGFPLLDPTATLRDVWVVDGKRGGSPTFNSITQLNRPRNDVVRNVHRQVLYDNWQNKSYRFSGTVGSVDAANRTIEFQNQRSDPATFRVHARLNAETELPSLPKGSTLTVYGRLTEVLESPWPLRVVTFELTDAEILPDSEP